MECWDVGMLGCWDVGILGEQVQRDHTLILTSLGRWHKKKTLGTHRSYFIRQRDDTPQEKGRDIGRTRKHTNTHTHTKKKFNFKFFLLFYSFKQFFCFIIWLSTINLFFYLKWASLRALPFYLFTNITPYYEALSIYTIIGRHFVFISF